MVVALPRQHPWEVAKRAATIDRLSGGRLVIGAGLGSIPQDHRVFGDDIDVAGRAARLDEALAVVTGLWSGEPFAFEGEHFHVDAPPMLPVPVQQPRIPIWIGGGWPHRRPFRRAARFDGVMPVHSDYGKGTTMPPEELARAVEFVASLRESSAPFDVAIEGATRVKADDVRRVARYADAGATWWVEALGWWRGDAAVAFARVAAGPPG
jgi:alkanesulfonate monooxygenase SsuD/methylene tetrahydromethanopterin reductase-like flavin-dependent oxidoreductase (luciferase family)